MMVEELEVISDNDEPIVEVVDLSLPKVPDMLGVDDDETPAKKEAVVEEVVSADCDEAGATLLIEVADDKGEGKVKEVSAAEATEVVGEDFITPDDIEREKVIEEINEIADSADSALKIRVPFIEARTTKNNVINKFVSLNKHLLSNKYHSLVDCDIHLNGEMYSAMLDDVKANVSALTKAQASKAAGRSFGFVDSGKGYLADINF